MDYTKAKNYTAMAQQMTGIYKSTVDNIFNAMAMIQESTGEDGESFSGAIPLVSRRGKEVCQCLDKGLQERV